MKYLRTFEESRLTKFIHKVKKAKKYATDAHAGVFRRGKDEDGNKIPYIIHPDTVAKIVHDVKDSEYIAHLIAAAYLHDVVEDVEGISVEDIRKEFGDIVAGLVGELTTDLEKMKISGKEEYLIDKMLNMSSWALVIKMADRLHNLSDFKQIMASDDKKRQKWAKGYAKQTMNIINEVEWYRDLSDTQTRLVKKIKKRLNHVLKNED